MILDDSFVGQDPPEGGELGLDCGPMVVKSNSYLGAK